MRIVLAVLATALLAACASPSPSPSPSPTSEPSSTASPISGDCQDMTHVYNPQRLQVLSVCEHVKGIVILIRSEADGDYHILVQPDPNQPDPQGGSWVNSCNSTCAGGAEHGDLVTEPVCMHSITQPDAVSACAGYTNTAILPKVGDHVLVSGPWVLDTAHGWLEIHPATYQLLPAFSSGDNS